MKMRKWRKCLMLLFVSLIL
uniref:Uncharacterized protein n=1 Tax=Rhizophora mucronata TaxID=61149 RepID=A0A2P2R076_RHIMU